MITAMSVNGNECEKVFPLIQRAGFDGVDLGLHAVDMGNEDDRVWKKRIEEIIGLLEKYDLKCAQVHLPFYGIFDSSEIYSEKMERAIKNAFCAMKMLGAKWGAHHPQSSTGFDYDRKRAMHDNKEKIKGYLEEAAKYDVGIAVENIPIFPDCPQYKFFSALTEDHFELVDSFKSDLVQVCWDFGHAHLMHYDEVEALKTFGSMIKILHVHNNYGVYDMHLSPSIGGVDWDDMVKTLKSFGYNGPLALEVNIHQLKEEYWERFINYCGEDSRLLEEKFICL